MKIDLGGGAYLEPDEGPRDTRFHKRILRTEVIQGMRAGHQLTLECGHGVLVIGNLALAAGVVFCTKCRDLEEG